MGKIFLNGEEYGSGGIKFTQYDYASFDNTNVKLPLTVDSSHTVEFGFDVNGYVSAMALYGTDGQNPHFYQSLIMYYNAYACGSGANSEVIFGTTADCTGQHTFKCGPDGIYFDNTRINNYTGVTKDTASYYIGHRGSGANDYKAKLNYFKILDGNNIPIIDIVPAKLEMELNNEMISINYGLLDKVSGNWYRNDKITYGNYT